MVEPTCEQFHAWKYIGKPVHTVRCDNAGENKLLEQLSQALNDQSKYTDQEFVSSNFLTLNIL